MSSFDFVKAARDQALFVASMFSIFGLIMTDSYYTTFGIKYQFLSLGAAHIVYRGFTLIYFNPAFFIIFMAIVISVAVSQFNFYVRMGGTRVSGRLVIYAILIIALIAGGWLSHETGYRTAITDMYPNSTSLRALGMFSSKDAGKEGLMTSLLQARERPLILHSSGAQIVVFQPPKIAAEHPRVEVYHVSLGPDDVYSDHVPSAR